MNELAKKLKEEIEAREQLRTKLTTEINLLIGMRHRYGEVEPVPVPSTKAEVRARTRAISRKRGTHIKPTIRSKWIEQARDCEGRIFAMRDGSIAECMSHKGLSKPSGEKLVVMKDYIQGQGRLVPTSAGRRHWVPKEGKW